MARRSRLGWTLAHLIDAGARGVTPLEAPALRWSTYVHRLRERGIPIDTELEEHGGCYNQLRARTDLEEAGEDPPDELAPVSTGHSGIAMEA